MQFFFSGNSAVDQSREALVHEAIWKVCDRLNEVKKLDGIKDKQEKCGQVVCEGCGKTKRQKKKQRQKD